MRDEGAVDDGAVSGSTGGTGAGREEAGSADDPHAVAGPAGRFAVLKRHRPRTSAVGLALVATATAVPPALVRDGERLRIAAEPVRGGVDEGHGRLEGGGCRPCRLAAELGADQQLALPAWASLPRSGQGSRKGSAPNFSMKPGSLSGIDRTGANPVSGKALRFSLSWSSRRVWASISSTRVDLTLSPS